MPIVINTNTAASYAANNLNTSNASLQKSLNRLSSGTRIVNPSDDAGGLAVSLRMQATVRRTDAVNANITNAVSFLQTQDGALKTVGKILDRVSELKTLYSDGTKSATDQALYDKEFVALRDQMRAIVGGDTVAGGSSVEASSGASFNGVQLFTLNTAATSAGTLSVSISEDGAQTVNISQANLEEATGLTDVLTATSLNVALSNITSAIDTVATARAQNGAEQSRLQFASEMLTINKANLESANSRIIDVDVASESTALARFNILTQAGTSMLAQANSSAQNALRLLS